MENRTHWFRRETTAAPKQSYSRSAFDGISLRIIIVSGKSGKHESPAVVGTGFSAVCLSLPIPDSRMPRQRV